MASSFPGFMPFLLPAKTPPTTNLDIPSSPPSSSSSSSSSSSRRQLPLPLAKPSPRLPQERDTSRSSDDFDISAVICPSLAHSNALFFASSLCRKRRTAIPQTPTAKCSPSEAGVNPGLEQPPPHRSGMWDIMQNDE